MNLLVVTNLYPPQELGGYGRSIADFVWGLRERGHSIQVLSSDAPHLGASSALGPSGEAVDRRLQLKGSYEGGVRHLQDPQQRQAIDETNATLIRTRLNRQQWDGILLGNLDLLGPELLPPLLETQCIVQHHVGFVHAPFHPSAWPNSDRYRLVAASEAVRSALVSAGLPTSTARVVYPGVRSELFGVDRVGMPTPLQPDGSRSRPLKVCFAGLLMGSKGAHTLIEALIQLQQKGISVQASIAGDSFQNGYREQLEQRLLEHNMNGAVQFVGQLGRHALARFYALHHVGVFPSIHPEAFGIVAAEMMASGLVVVSSGVGGAGELIDDGRTGVRFKCGDSDDLAKCLMQLLNDPTRLGKLREEAVQEVQRKFSVAASAAVLEEGFKEYALIRKEKTLF
ncbi:MAG: hypothetical protein CBC25_00570 [Pelagibacteraceae bacterium TMED65]|nr:MAG: hypothetical protein CBC25_00570 [Pelagibacteraceae bacterium TMED65]